MQRRHLYARVRTHVNVVCHGKWTSEGGLSPFTHTAIMYKVMVYVMCGNQGWDARQVERVKG